LLQPDALRLLPAKPWQKSSLQASDAARVAMLELAFRDAALAVTIDQRELTRGRPSFTVETLRELRAELGADTAIVFLMGADQLHNLASWRDWQQLFDLANIGVAARPGYTLAQESLPPQVAQALAPRMATPEHVRTTPAGLVCLAHTLAVDISATAVRAVLQGHGTPGKDADTDLTAFVSPVVLDYIQQHHLYKS
jgi:nicotinate-nucleotide adenylyltransferase